MRQPYPLTYHKAGDTWDRTHRYTLPAGTWTATSTARTADGTLVQTFTCALTTLSADPDGYTHALNTTATATDTADWPLATLLADVVFTDASATPVKRSSSAFQIAACAYLPEVLDDYTNLAVIPGDLLALVRGEDGPPGAGMPAGGTAGQVLAKASNINYDLAWVDQTGAGGTGATNLAYTASATGGTVTSDTGTDATLPLADGTNAGLMTPAEKAKIAATSGTNTGDQDLSGYSLTSHNHSGTYDPAGTASAALSAHTGAADPHTQYVLESTVGAAGGVASLDGAGQVPAAQIPAIAITELLGTVASQSAMLALSGQKGDWCIRTDTGTTWIITGTNPALLAGWTELVYPAAPVSSVAGRAGAVTLTSSDLTDTTAAGRALLDDVDAAAQRATLGLGDAATKNTGTTAGTVAAGDDARLSDARTPTSHAHALADLTQSGATTGQVPVWNGSAWAPATPSAGGGGTKTLAVFSPLANQPPASAFATLDTRNSVPVLDFDAAADESAVFSAVVPEGASLTSGIVVNLVWMATSATSGNVRWRVAFERRTTDQDSDSFDTATEATSAANGTSGICSTASITCTTIDSIVAGDSFRVRVTRVGTDATNDTMTGDAELVAVELRAA